MTNYRVAWEIDIEAETPEDAVLQARQLQLDTGAQVGYFTAHWYHTVDGYPCSKDIDLDTQEMT